MLKLYMFLLGGRPPGRHTEQHDVFFAIGENIKALVPDMRRFWPETYLHIDAWREVTAVDGYKISAEKRTVTVINTKEDQLFFINLGGYQRGLFDELHFKMLTVQKSKADAVKQAKGTAFYKEAGYPGGESHIDDHFGIDVDDIYKVADILPHYQKEKYSLSITKPDTIAEDELHIGYYKLSGFE